MSAGDSPPERWIVARAGAKDYEIVGVFDRERPAIDACCRAGFMAFVFAPDGKLYEVPRRLKVYKPRRWDLLGQLANAHATGAYCEGAEVVGLDDPAATPDWRRTLAEVRECFAKSGDTFTEFDRSQYFRKVRLAVALGKPVSDEVVRQCREDEASRHKEFP